MFPSAEALRPRRLLAAFVVLAFMSGQALPDLALADNGGGVIRGLLYEKDGKSRLLGGRIIAINVATGERYESNLTGENGAYEITDLPAGTYDVVLETAGELYVADNLIDLGRGQRFSISYSLQPERPANRLIEGMADPSGTADIVGAFRGTGPAGAARDSIWGSAGGVVSIIVLTVGAGLVLASVFDDDDDASPFTP